MILTEEIAEELVSEAMDGEGHASAHGLTYIAGRGFFVGSVGDVDSGAVRITIGQAYGADDAEDIVTAVADDGTTITAPLHLPTPIHTAVITGITDTEAEETHAPEPVAPEPEPPPPPPKRRRRSTEPQG